MSHASQYKSHNNLERLTNAAEWIIVFVIILTGNVTSVEQTTHHTQISQTLVAVGNCLHLRSAVYICEELQLKINTQARVRFYGVIMLTYLKQLDISFRV